jgi:hypothetical protein
MFSLLIALLPAAAHAGVIDCSYQFMGAPFARIQLGISADGAPDDYVTSIVQGHGHRESFTLSEAAADELLHGWISKESNENSIEMIVFRVPRREGQSKIVNHHVPMGQEMWGSCSL